MSFIKTTGPVISGIAACVPQNRFDVVNFPFPTEQEKNDFINKVGVHSKRIAPPGMTASDLCVAAAEDLLQKLGWKKEEVDLLVFATQTPDYLIPFGSADIQHRLGLSNDCAAFDFHTGCSGWVYGLSFIYSFLKTYGLKKALLLAGETSYIVSEKDKSVFPLIGDAGTATAVSLDDSTSESFFYLQTFGKNSQAIMIPDGGARKPTTADSLVMKTYGEGLARTGLHSYMDGQRILEFSLLTIPGHIQKLLDQAHISNSEIDALVMHQANKILCESIRKRLKIEPNKVPYSIENFGNTSSASVPLTVVTGLDERLKTQSLLTLLSGFGVGLSAASAILTLHKDICISFSEL